MEIEWSDEAASDLIRLHLFLADKNELAAARTVQQLLAAPGSLLLQPRRGPIIERYLPRELRRLIVGSYELQYEVRNQTIYVANIFHLREER